MTGREQLKVLQISLQTLPLSRDLGEGEREKPRSTHVTCFPCCYSGVGRLLGFGIMNQSRAPLLDFPVRKIPSLSTLLWAQGPSGPS